VAARLGTRQTVRRRFRLANYAKPTQIWGAREVYPANADFNSVASLSL
jgi:hypothetical protein